MLQNIIVLIIVSVAIFFTCRRLYRILSSRKVKCGCTAEEDCSACSVPKNTKESGFGGS
ncbi:MAG: FeoB-associated Cys-rich membrane protein [Deltaproteobacteria bacterium]|nr:MAG: FeoB-associated Cys-rich membrane protein [Deltaproteobacteria bacterium]